MTQKWQYEIETQHPEHAGVIIDAIQRHLQFDTFAGVIPFDALDLFFTEDRMGHICEQALNFSGKHHDVLAPLPQKTRETAIRAHLAGIIKLPVPSPDLWHDSFTELHERNRTYYEKLTTAGRVELLMNGQEDADIIAASVSKYQSDTFETYTPADLITWTVNATRFYRSHHSRLSRYSTKEQRAIIAHHLAGKSDIAW